MCSSLCVHVCMHVHVIVHMQVFMHVLTSLYVHVCVCCMYMPVVMLMNNLCCFPQNNFWDISKYHVLDYSISLKGN